MILSKESEAGYGAAVASLEGQILAPAAVFLSVNDFANDSAVLDADTNLDYAAPAVK